ncbi:MAG: hypothetical protein Tp1123DCM1511741_56 [Prokaryotic dsDNA virus sp.]|nr:MAG: hypothetical protein Tp1123DCM1511741_56 [Prokaryotic dsDNA virus sp.]|tara:strand:+ start:2114 stop:3580 length:1467 start_codon:yes stop_codon:yes gene_type:complete
MNKFKEIFWLSLAVALILGMISSMLNAEERTTGNLITNGTFENGNANGWTTGGNGQVISDCCGSNYDYEFGNSGFIEQSFDLTSDTITQQMLNNGISLNSNIQIQNGECSVSGCWGGQGGADSFTIRLQIQDSENNILSTTTQTRTDTTGINGEYFSNSVSYTGTGSNIGDIKISGTDANAPATLGGANLDNISVTMTYDDTVLTATQTTELNTTFQEIEELIEIVEEIIPETFEELFVEEITLEELILEIEPEIIEAIEETFIEEEIVLTTLAVLTEYQEELNISEEVIEMAYEEPLEIASEEIIEETIEEPIEEVNNEPKEETTRESVAVENGTTETEENNRAENGTVAEESTGGMVSESVETEVATEDVNMNTNEEINIDSITEEIARTVQSLDKRLLMTSDAITKAMTSSISLEDYGKINNDMFIQAKLDGGTLYGYDKQYIDTRVLYNELSYNDPMTQYQQRVDIAKQKTKDAEEYLKWILKQ